jgi:hypothetical protein
MFVTASSRSLLCCVSHKPEVPSTSSSHSSLPKGPKPDLITVMSDPSKKSRLLRPFKGLFSRRGRSPSHQGAQSVTPHNASASISTLPTNSATSAPQVNPQGTEYTAILELSTTPSDPLTWEHRMKDWGSTAYDGLKAAIQGIYDCSSSFPPLHTTAGVLLTISKVVDVRRSMCSTCKYVIDLSSESVSE